MIQHGVYIVMSKRKRGSQRPRKSQTQPKFSGSGLDITLLRTSKKGQCVRDLKTIHLFTSENVVAILLFHHLEKIEHGIVLHPTRITLNG